jgi:hypothetical protein
MHACDATTPNPQAKPYSRPPQHPCRNFTNHCQQAVRQTCSRRCVHHGPAAAVAFYQAPTLTANAAESQQPTHCCCASKLLGTSCPFASSTLLHQVLHTTDHLLLLLAAASHNVHRGPRRASSSSTAALLIVNLLLVNLQYCCCCLLRPATMFIGHKGWERSAARQQARGQTNSCSCE